MIKKQMSEKKCKFMVRVNCMTYNHAAFIEDALNGFCMQETDFPFVCTIVDDASTDGEQEIIKQYLLTHFDMEDKSVVRNDETDDYHLTYARHKTNRNCYFVVIFLKYNHFQIKKSKRPYLAEWDSNSKYIAFCEGDDYWINSKKIQNQVTIMNEEEGIGLCYCSYYTNKNNIVYGAPYMGIEQLIIHNRMATVTVMVRREFYEKYYEDINPYSRGWKMGDYPCWLWMELNSKVIFLDMVVAVYRVLDESASHSKDISKRLSFVESTREVRLFYATKYNLDQAIIDGIEDAYWRGKASLYKSINKPLYRGCLKHIKAKTIKDRLNYLISIF